jgi:ribosomal protein S18 acetylase RimI-like enzyme
MLTFHAAGPDDSAKLRALAERIWRASYVEMISAAQVGYMLDWMYSEETIRREMAEGVVWEFARLDGGNAGFFSVTFGDGGVAKLNKLYLLAELQGRGLGQQMLDRVFTIARSHGAREVRLQVNKMNRRAQHAYERYGFARVGEGVFEIGGGFVMDDFIMARAV